MRVNTVTCKICNHAEIIATMREHGNVPLRFRQAAQVAQDSFDLTWIRGRVETMQPGSFTVLAGKVGTGKTFGLHYARVALYQSKMFLHMTDSTLQGAADVMHDALHCGHKHLATDYRAMFIDELGAEHESAKSDWTAAQWDRLFNQAYERMRYVWISTNLTDAQLRERYGQRIWSRMTDQPPGWLRTFKTVYRGADGTKVSKQEAENG